MKMQKQHPTFLNGLTAAPTAIPLSLQGEVGWQSLPGEGAPTPTVLPLHTAPPDPYATMAAAMLTPVPTDTPLAMASVPPDPYATMAAETAAPLSSPTPLATATAGTAASPASPLATVAQVQTQTPQVITSPTPQTTPLQTLTTTSQPSLERYYYHANRLYSVAALTDAQGNIVERYQYNAYGLCTTFNANYELPLTFSRFGNPFTFTGRELDPETDLMHYRERPYGPKEGRFKQQDPIGYQDGMNLYQYVASNPTTNMDPFGWESASSQPVVCKTCGPDVTDWLVNQLINNWNDPRITQIRNNWWWGYVPGANIAVYADNFTNFANLVGKKMEWDFKATQPFTSIKCPENCPRTVTLCGSCYNYDVPGNINYGFVGISAGFSQRMLLNAAGGDLDYPEDQQAIRIGFILAENSADSDVLKSKLCLWVNAYSAQLNKDGTGGCTLCDERY